LNQKNKKSAIDEMIDSDNKRNFEVKWMDKLVDIDRELEGDFESKD
jgi:hypothetical protein